MKTVSISNIEGAINKCSREFPMPEGELSAPGILLAEVYGLMIYDNLAEIDTDAIAQNKFASLSEKHAEVVERFCS